MSTATFNGRWVLDSSDNFEAYVESLAMDGSSKAKLLQSVPTLNISHSGEEITIVYEGSDRNVKVVPGQNTEHKLFNGCVVQANSMWDGDCLVTRSTGEQGKTHTTTREIVDRQLIQTFEFDGVKSVRRFRKL